MSAGAQRWPAEVHIDEVVEVLHVARRHRIHRLVRDRPWLRGRRGMACRTHIFLSKKVMISKGRAVALRGERVGRGGGVVGLVRSYNENQSALQKSCSCIHKIKIKNVHWGGLDCVKRFASKNRSTELVRKHLFKYSALPGRLWVWRGYVMALRKVLSDPLISSTKGSCGACDGESEKKRWRFVSMYRHLFQKYHTKQFNCA